LKCIPVVHFLSEGIGGTIVVQFDQFWVEVVHLEHEGARKEESDEGREENVHTKQGARATKSARGRERYVHTWIGTHQTQRSLHAAVT